MSFRDQMARRSAAFQISPWSEAADLLGGHADPIYFGNGAPSVETQPIERMQWAADVAWAEAAGVLDYGDLAGYAPLRELIANRMVFRGISAQSEHIIVTNGSQQGIDLIAKLMLDPGDSIVVEGPTYIGAMQTFDAYEARYLTCPVDECGLRADVLEEILRSTHPTPKLMYLMPTFQNPSGFSMSAERQRAVLDLAAHYGVMVIEDDPYGEIYYADPGPLPALRASSDDVIYLGSFSKTMAPGIRVGWMVVPPSLVDVLLMAKESADINSNRMAMRMVFHAAEGFLDDHLVETRTRYQARRNALLDALDASMPTDVVISRPEGGFFVWAELPPGCRSNDLLHLAARHGVGFLPGSWFYPASDRQHSGLRLSFSSLPFEHLAEGGRRLGDATTEFLQSRTGQV